MPPAGLPAGRAEDPRARLLSPAGPDRDRVVLGRGWLARGALEETTGRNSIDCSREQIGQFWISRL
jgi:hypothetical protein